jgi:hypothetical protein
MVHNITLSMSRFPTADAIEIDSIMGFAMIESGVGFFEAICSSTTLPFSERAERDAS